MGWRAAAALVSGMLLTNGWGGGRPAAAKAAAAANASQTTWQPRCPADASIAALEQTMFVMVNRARENPQYRAETGGAAPMLWWNARIADVARCHSEDMIEHGYFDHRDREGSTPGSRLTRAGVVWSRAAENIALAGSVQEAEAMLMNEPPFQPNHRGNILNPHFERIGIGIARNGSGRLYITQDFITP